MGKFLEKITAYNIFTNLLPSILFCYLAEQMLKVVIVANDL